MNKFVKKIIDLLNFLITNSEMDHKQKIAYDYGRYLFDCNVNLKGIN